MTDQAGVVRFGVAHDEMVNRGGIDLCLQKRQPGGLEFEMAGVDQGCALAPHQKGVVSRAVAQAKFDVKATAVPVKRTNRGRIFGDRYVLQAEARQGCLQGECCAGINGYGCHRRGHARIGHQL